jgi:OOP family OmpA-OmpF porin
MRSILIIGAAMLTVIAAPTLTCAADQQTSNRFYGGMSIGASRLDKSDANGSMFKLYGGYQFTEHFGAEAGFLRGGDLAGDAPTSNDSPQQSARSRAFYTAGTARWQISERFSLNGMLGVAYHEVSGDETAGDGDLDRENAAFIVGFGAQYRLTPRVELTANADHLSDATEESGSSDLITAGVVFRF